MYEPRHHPRTESLELRGLRHHVTRWGPVEAPPIVLLHGWMDAGATFQFLVDAFDERHAFVAPDFRGFGQSEWEPHGYWFPNYLADLDALLDVVSPREPAIVVGHSMGGNVASLYAGVKPERVKKLVNIEGLGLPRTTPEQAPARYREWLEQLRGAPSFASYSSFEQLAGFLAGRNPRLPPQHAQFIARAWAREIAPGRIEIRSDPRHKVINAVLYRREEVEACWRRIRAPVLLLVAEHSEFRPRLGADASDEKLHSLIENLSLVTIAGAGHMMHHEKPAEVARAIADFLAAFPAQAPEKSRAGSAVDVSGR
jgi:pimeloyl-ACP methyl ester carboxylesterase